MNITIIGCGYVGLVTAASFTEYGNRVTCVDTDCKKIQLLQNNKSPIYENKLEEVIARAADRNLLNFTTDYKDALKECDICFITVGTPQNDNGSPNLAYIKSAAEQIGNNLNHKCLIVSKSTVPVGTAENIEQDINKHLKNRHVNFHITVAANPEFLKEGKALQDSMYPDRIIIGSSNKNDIETLTNLYKPFVKNTNNILVMTARSAEMAKYAANSMLATKISFMNEIANICECVGADVNDVRLGVGSDKRIGYEYIYPGCGYGGSCFPKDVRSMVNFAENAGYDAQLLRSVDKVNTEQRNVLSNKILDYFNGDISGLTFAVWGLAFKPGTDDMREAPSISVITNLLRAGAKIKAYDPKATNKAKEIFTPYADQIQYCDNAYDCLSNTNGLVIVTEWQEFKSPNFGNIKDSLKTPIIFDGRNLYSEEMLKNIGLDYIQIGVASKCRETASTKNQTTTI